ncbi:uncharacterized protein LOC118419298 isoform X2 [Branchiostoma floridae]|uniref:Uncharacterized protein LOC118419298 isoform X2 n=1 Tax=Branchiostoma floridae TaxID=7739 RepID=A0A9J7LEY9_BRAFL|nr:uncharacterized protein LOC118419298 isoform X2 [Branchiostoma floridae]
MQAGPQCVSAMGAIWRRARQTSFGSSYGNYFYFITSLIFAQVTSEYRFNVLAPDTHVAMSTEVDVEYSIPTQAELENAVIEVYDILNSSVTRVAPVPVGIHDGHMNFSCAIFDHAGGFLFKLLLEEGGPILVESEIMDVVWQDFSISVPNSHEAMTGEVQVGVRTEGEVCSSQPRRFRTNFVVKYLGTNDTVDQSVKPSIVTTQTLDIQSQETHVTVSCESLDQAGLYRVELRSEFNDSLIASSQDFPVKWSENYALTTEKHAIFPCVYVVDVSFYTPVCHGHDRVRLYRQGAGLAGQASDQLEYVTEQRIRPGKTFVQFTCSEFDPSFPVYCFKYVSIARRGAVTEQATLCLPSQYSAPAIDGNWGTWEPWSSCPVTCGEGRIQRFRVCNNPPPSNGGAFCEGETLESGSCQGLPPCPADLRTLPPLTVRPVATDNCACGCTLRAPQGGVTRPPYGACAGVVTWLIWVLEDYKIRLEFEVFDLDKTQERLKIRDGGEATSPLLFSTGSDPPTTLTSSGSRVFIEFRVQPDLQSYSTRGFQASYSSFQLVPSTTAVTTTAAPEEPLTWWQKVEKFFKLEIFQNPVTVAGIVLCALVVIGSIIAVICTRMCRRRKRTAAYAASAQSEVEGGGTQSPRSLSLNHIEATSIGAQSQRSQRSGRDRREQHLSDMSMSDLSHTSRRKPKQNGKVPTGYANHIYSASAPETPQRFTTLEERPSSPTVQGQFPTPYQLAQEQLKLMRQHGLEHCEQLYDFSMAGPPMEPVVPSPYTGALPSNVPGNAYFHPIQQPYSVQETTFTQAPPGPENYSNNNAHVYILDPRFENHSPTHSNKEKRKSRSPVRDSKSPRNSPNKRQLPTMPKPQGRKLPVAPRPAFYADQEMPAAGLSHAAVTASDPQLAHATRKLRREKSEKKSLTPNISRRKNRVEKFVYQPSPYNSLDRAITTRHSKRSSKHRSKGSVKKSRTTENFAAQVHSPSDVPSSTDGMRSSQEIRIRGPSERRKGHGHSHRLGSQGSLGKASSKASKEELHRSSREQLPKYPGSKSPDKKVSEKGQTPEKSMEVAQVVERRESSPEHKKIISNPSEQRKSASPDRKSPQKSLDLRKLGNEHSLYEHLGLNDKKPKTGRRLAHYAAQSEDSRSQFSSEGSSAYAMTMTQKLFHFDDSERDQYRTSIGPVGETVFEDLRKSADLDDVVTPNGHVISGATEDAKSPSNGDVSSNHSRRQLPRTPSLDIDGRKTPHDQVFVDKTPDPEYDYYMPDLPGSFLKMDQTYIGRPKPITTNQNELKNIQVQLESCPPDAVRM